MKWVQGVRAKLTERQWRALRLWGPIALGALLLLLLAASWLPSLAESRIRERLAPHGLEFRADIGLSLSGAALNDVEVRTKAGKPLLRAERIEADVAFWSGELRALSLAHATIEIELNWMKEWRARRSSGSGGASQPAGGARKLPPVRVEDARVLLRDGHGTFLDASGLSATVQDGKVEARLAKTTL
ncbi:MAG TPA: hypothetical protein VFZ61_00010, partial [Polyangiales bacterium]